MKRNGFVEWIPLCVLSSSDYVRLIKDLIVVVAFVGVLAALDWAHRKSMAKRHSAGMAAQALPMLDQKHVGGQAISAGHPIQEIMRGRCGNCHCSGGPAPFALTTYDDVAKRAQQILEVTQSGYMPPWLPSASDYPFKNDRSLPAAEREAIAEWVDAGLPRKGWKAGGTDGETKQKWQLGPPDLVLKLEQPFSMAADSPELFWNFVLPADDGVLKSPAGEIPSNSRLVSSRFVKAVEIKPGNQRAVHHIIGQLDRTGSAQRKQQELGTNGFAGMEFEQGEIVAGLSMLWSPGKAVSPGREGVAWQLTPNTDVLLQMHLFPTGKPEVIQPEVGIYFAEQSPTAFPLSLMLEVPELEIPPGESAHVSGGRVGASR